MKKEMTKLSKKEFTNYHNKFKQGDRDALNYLMTTYEWIVDYLIEYFKIDDLDKKEELKSSGLECLWIALKNFSFDKSNDFTHYAITIIKNRFIYELKARKKSNIEISLTDIKNKENSNVLLNELNYNENVENLYIKKETYLSLKNLVDGLPADYAFVIKNYFNQVNIKNLVKDLNVSRTTILNYKKHALNILKNKLIDNNEFIFPEINEQQHNLYLRNYPQNIYDLFIQRTTGKRLDKSVVDLLFYFVSPYVLKQIKDGLSKSSIRAIILSDLNIDDVYNRNPDDVIIKYLNSKIRYIHKYFKDLNTGRILDEKIVDRLIKRNRKIKQVLSNNGLAFNLKNVVIRDVDNWHNIRSIAQQIITGLTERLNTDIFALSYEEFLELYNKTYGLTLK